MRKLTGGELLKVYGGAGCTTLIPCPAGYTGPASCDPTTHCKPNPAPAGSGSKGRGSKGHGSKGHGSKGHGS